MTYKQTISGILNSIQETLLVVVSLILLSVVSPTLLPFDQSLLFTLLTGVTFIWIGSLVVLYPRTYPILSSDYIDPDFLGNSTDRSRHNKLRRYASGFEYTNFYIASRLYAVLTRTLLLGSFLALIHHSLGNSYTAGVLFLYIALPTIYAFLVSRSDTNSIDSIDDSRFDSDDLKTVIEDLSNFFGIRDPRLHVSQSSEDSLFVVKSLFTKNTLVFSPEEVNNIASDDNDLNKTDRFKLAHEFAHLSIGSSYTMYSQMCLLGLSFLYYWIVTSMTLSPTILVLVSTGFVLVVRLAINYIKRIEELKADEMASKFIDADDEDIIFALVSVTNSDENPFTYPYKTTMGKLYTMFLPHPPITVRVKSLTNRG